MTFLPSATFWMTLSRHINVIPGFRCPPSSYLKMSGFKVGFAAFFPRFKHYAVSKVGA